MSADGALRDALCNSAGLLQAAIQKASVGGNVTLTLGQAKETIDALEAADKALARRSQF